MLDHPHQNHCLNMQETLMLICMQTINFITHFLLNILQRNSKLVILGNLGMPGYVHLKDSINLQKTFAFNCKQKINFISDVFREKLQRYANFLFWVLWACLVSKTQNDSINLQKTSRSICMPKVNFIIHFFLGILHFKESCNFMANSILAHNSRTRVLPVMGFAVKYQQQYQFSFQINSRKN